MSGGVKRKSSGGHPLVEDWYHVRVRIDENKCLDELMKLLSQLCGEQAYVIMEENADKDTNRHVHCLFNCKLCLKSVKNRFWKAYKDAGLCGNGIYSLKQAEHSLEMAAAYTCKERRKIAAQGLGFSDEQIEKYADKWAEHVAENKSGAPEGKRASCIKAEVLKQCLEAELKPHHEDAILKIMWEVVHDADVQYSDYRFGDLLSYVQMHLAGKAETEHYKKWAEKMKRRFSPYY